MLVTLKQSCDRVSGVNIASRDGGLCCVRDVLPDVLERYDIAWPPAAALPLTIFADHSAADAATSCTC